jgi:hypothetical protein
MKVQVTGLFFTCFLIAHALADDAKKTATTTLGELEQTARVLGSYSYNRHQDPLSQQGIEKRTYIESAKSRMKDPVRDSVDLALSISLNSKNIPIADKQEIRQKVLIRFDETRTKMGTSADPYKESQALDEAIDIVSSMKIPEFEIRGIEIGKAMNETKEILGKGVKAAHHSAVWVANQVGGESGKAAIRSEGSAEMQGYLDSINQVGGVENILESAYYACKGDNCDFINLVSREKFFNITPTAPVHQNLGQATPEVKGILIGGIEHAVIAGKIGETEEKILAKVNETAMAHARQIAVTEARLTAQNAQLAKAVGENSLKLDELKQSVAATRAEIKGLRADFKTQISALRNDLTAAIENNSDRIIDEIRKSMTQQTELLHNDIVAIGNFLRAKATEEANARDQEAKAQAIENSYRNDVKLMEGLAGVASLIVKDQDARRAIRAAQGCVVATLQLKRALQVLQHARAALGKGKKLSSAVLQGFTGDVFGAIVGLAGVFGESTDAQILKQLALIREDIKAAREEIHELRKEVREGFARVENKMDFYFERTFGRFDDVIDAIADVRVDVARVHELLQDVRLTQAQVQAELPKLSDDIVNRLTATMEDNERLRFYAIQRLLKGERLRPENLDALFSDSFTYAEDISRDKKRRRDCAHQYATVFDCEILYEDDLLAFARQLLPNLAVDPQFNFPWAEKRDPWLSLYDQAVLAAKPLLAGEENAKFRQTLSQDLTDFENTTQAERTVITTLRTPQVRADGVAYLPAFEPLTKGYLEHFNMLRAKLAAYRAPREAELAKEVITERIRVEDSEQRIDVPNHLLVSMVPLLVREYLAQSKARIDWTAEIIGAFDHTDYVTEEEVIEYNLEVPTSRDLLEKRKWVAISKFIRDFHTPLVQLRGKLNINGKEVRVVEFTTTGRKPILMYEQLIRENKPPRTMKYRVKPKKPENDQFGEYERRELVKEIYSKSFHERFFSEKNTRDSEFKAFWDNALANPSEWKVGGDWGQLLPFVVQHNGEKDRALTFDALRLIKATANQTPYIIPPEDVVILTELQAELKLVLGHERVMIELLQFAIPEAFDRTEWHNGGGLFGARNFRELRSLSELDAIEDPKSGITAILAGVAETFRKNPELVSKIPKLEVIEALTKQAKESLE